VTLQGDVFDVSGTLEGGAPLSQSSVLAAVSQLAEVSQHLAARKDELAACEAELATLTQVWHTHSRVTLINHSPINRSPSERAFSYIRPCPLLPFLLPPSLPHPLPHPLTPPPPPPPPPPPLRTMVCVLLSAAIEALRGPVVASGDPRARGCAAVPAAREQPARSADVAAARAAGATAARRRGHARRQRGDGRGSRPRRTAGGGDARR
jgi:hypothetical protein